MSDMKIEVPDNILFDPNRPLNEDEKRIFGTVEKRNELQARQEQQRLNEYGYETREEYDQTKRQNDALDSLDSHMRAYAEEKANRDIAEIYKNVFTPEKEYELATGVDPNESYRDNVSAFTSTALDQLSFGLDNPTETERLAQQLNPGTALAGSITGLIGGTAITGLATGGLGSLATGTAGLGRAANAARGIATSVKLGQAAKKVAKVNAAKDAVINSTNMAKIASSAKAAKNAQPLIKNYFANQAIKRMGISGIHQGIYNANQVAQAELEAYDAMANTMAVMAGAGLGLSGELVKSRFAQVVIQPLIGLAVTAGHQAATQDVASFQDLFDFEAHPEIAQQTLAGAAIDAAFAIADIVSGKKFMVHSAQLRDGLSAILPNSKRFKLDPDATGAVKLSDTDFRSIVEAEAQERNMTVQDFEVWVAGNVTEQQRISKKYNQTTGMWDNAIEGGKGIERAGVEMDKAAKEADKEAIAEDKSIESMAKSSIKSDNVGSVGGTTPVSPIVNNASSVETISQTPKAPVQETKAPLSDADFYRQQDIEALARETERQNNSYRNEYANKKFDSTVSYKGAMKRVDDINNMIKKYPLVDHSKLNEIKAKTEASIPELEKTHFDNVLKKNHTRNIGSYQKSLQELANDIETLGKNSELASSIRSYASTVTKSKPVVVKGQNMFELPSGKPDFFSVFEPSPIQRRRLPTAKRVQRTVAEEVEEAVAPKRVVEPVIKRTQVGVAKLPTGKKAPKTIAEKIEAEATKVDSEVETAKDYGQSVVETANNKQLYDQFMRGNNQNENLKQFIKQPTELTLTKALNDGEVKVETTTKPTKESIAKQKEANKKNINIRSDRQKRIAETTMSDKLKSVADNETIARGEIKTTAKRLSNEKSSELEATQRVLDNKVDKVNKKVDADIEKAKSDYRKNSADAKESSTDAIKSFKDTRNSARASRKETVTDEYINKANNAQMKSEARIERFNKEIDNRIESINKEIKSAQRKQNTALTKQLKQEVKELTETRDYVVKKRGQKKQDREKKLEIIDRKISKLKSNISRMQSLGIKGNKEKIDSLKKQIETLETRRNEVDRIYDGEMLKLGKELESKFKDIDTEINKEIKEFESSTDSGLKQKHFEYSAKKRQEVRELEDTRQDVIDAETKPIKDDIAKIQQEKAELDRIASGDFESSKSFDIARENIEARGNKKIEDIEAERERALMGEDTRELILSSGYLKREDISSLKDALNEKVFTDSIDSIIRVMDEIGASNVNGHNARSIVDNLVPILHFADASKLTPVMKSLKMASDSLVKAFSDDISKLDLDKKTIDRINQDCYLKDSEYTAYNLASAYLSNKGGMQEKFPDLFEIVQDAVDYNVNGCREAFARFQDNVTTKGFSKDTKEMSDESKKSFNEQRIPSMEEVAKYNTKMENEDTFAKEVNGYNKTDGSFSDTLKGEAEDTFAYTEAYMRGDFNTHHRLASGVTGKFVQSMINYFDGSAGLRYVLGRLGKIAGDCTTKEQADSIKKSFKVATRSIEERDATQITISAYENDMKRVMLQIKTGEQNDFDVYLLADMLANSKFIPDDYKVKVGAIDLDRVLSKKYLSELNDEQLARFDKTRMDMHELRDMYVLKPLLDSGTLSKKQYESLSSDVHYVHTKAVNINEDAEKYYDWDRIMNATTGIRTREGLAEGLQIASPLSSTMKQDVALILNNSNNAAKLDTVVALTGMKAIESDIVLDKKMTIKDYMQGLVKEVEPINKAEIDAGIEAGVYIKPKFNKVPPNDMFFMEVIDAGTKRGFYVSKEIEDAFENNLQLKSCTDFLGKNIVMRTMKTLMTTANFGFGVFSFFGDFVGTSARVSPKYLLNIPKSFIGAIKSVDPFGRNWNMTDTYRQIAINKGGLSSFRGLNERFNFSKVTQSKGSPAKVLAPLERMLSFADDVGRIMEMTHKMAAFDYAKSKGYDSKTAAQISREFAGSPNYSKSGKNMHALNNIVMFLNPMVRGYDQFGQTIAGKSTAGKVGIATTLSLIGAKIMFDLYTDQNCEGITEDDIIKPGLTVPIGATYDANGKKIRDIAAKLPIDRSISDVGGLMYSFIKQVMASADGDPRTETSYSDPFKRMFNLLPGTIPLINMAMDTGEYLTTGNIKNIWGYNVLTKAEQDLGFFDNIGKLGGHFVGQTGIRSLVGNTAFNKATGNNRAILRERSFTDKEVDTEGAFAGLFYNISQLGGIPFFGSAKRFSVASNYGVYQDLQNSIKRDITLDSKRRIENERALERILVNGYDDTEEGYNEYYADLGTISSVDGGVLLQKVLGLDASCALYQALRKASFENNPREKMATIVGTYIESHGTQGVREALNKVL